MKQAQNRFTKGVIAGVDVLSHPSDALYSARNAEFLSLEGNLSTVVRQRGNSLAGQIRPGYVPVASASSGGIAYIFSVELNGRVPSGRAEIGTFPSPDWNAAGSHELLPRYSALMNYGGDTGLYPGLDGPFNSAKFRVQDGSDTEMELQNDYDGSVNILLNDGKNPVWIINSGFAAEEGNRARLIRRQGKSTNRYSVLNFENTLRLVLSSTRIMNVVFAGMREGGRLKAGSYRYYFYYMTADGTLTQLVNESSEVPVFNGNSASDIQGDRGTGDVTNKLVSFELRNLDTSFPFIKVYFTHSAGIEEAMGTSHELINPVRFTGTSAVFNHTGFEQQAGISTDLLNRRIGSIESVGSIAQIQGYLFAADIREKGRSMAGLRRFAASTRTGSRQISMDIFGTAPDLSGVALGKTGDARLADAYAGGYYNPYNCYHYTGYMGGESYPFGMVFVYRDGSVTPVFPVLGIDNLEGGRDGLLYAVTDAQIGQMLGSGGFLDQDTNLINTNGIYRFPSRQTNEGLLLDPFNPSRAKINGVTFRLPDLPQAEMKALREETLGFFFVRGERKPDLISQGYLIDTVTVPSVDLGLANENFQCMSQYRPGYSPITSKFVPAFDFVLEAVKSYETYGSGANRKRSNFKGRGGIHPFRFHFKDKDFAFREKFAFISAETMLEKDKALQVLSSRQLELRMLARVVCQYDFASQAATGTTADHFSLIRTVRFERSLRTMEARANWTVGGSGLKNNEGFSGGLFVNARLNGTGNSIEYPHFALHFNDYVGISLEQKLSLGESDPFSADGDGTFARGMLGKQSRAAALVNLYPKGGPRSAATLKSIYASTANESYRQISPRFYWDASVEGHDPALLVSAHRDAEGRITCFGGDCFVNPLYRKIFYNRYRDQTSPLDETGENSKSNVGYVLGLITESHLNAAIRSQEQADINEPGKRTFVPFGLAGNDPGDRFGEDNPLRASRLAESAVLNKGYRGGISQRDYFSVSDDNPFSGTRWFSRVLVSARHIPNSFDNGYRNLSGINFQDYNPELGKIVRIANFRDNLLAVFERGVLLVAVNERIQTGSDAAGAIFIQAQGVLPPAARPVSLQVGSRWHDSVVNAYGTVMGIDSDRNTLWSFDGESLKETSLFRYDAVLKDFLDSYRNGKKSLFKNIRANHLHSKIVWSFTGKSGGGDTVCYDLLLGAFTGAVDYEPMLCFSVSGKHYSFNARENFHRFYEQDSTEAPYGNYYGRQFPFRICFAVNADAELEKTFDNLTIISNHILPGRILYRTQGTQTLQRVVSDPRFRRLSNAVYRSNQAEIAIPAVGEVSDESEYGVVEKSSANARSLLRKKSRQKGHALLVELIYDGEGLVKIHSVLTGYRFTL